MHWSDRHHGERHQERHREPTTRTAAAAEAGPPAGPRRPAPTLRVRARRTGVSGSLGSGRGGPGYPRGGR